MHVWTLFLIINLFVFVAKQYKNKINFQALYVRNKYPANDNTTLSLCAKTLPHVTISPTISSTMPTSTMEFNEIVDDGPATRNYIVNDAGVK